MPRSLRGGQAAQPQALAQADTGRSGLAHLRYRFPNHGLVLKL